MTNQPTQSATFSAADDKRMVMGLRREASMRWTLWLSLANGGGLVVVGGQIAEHLASPFTYLMMPSCWFLALGLVAVGGTAWLRTVRFGIVASWLGDAKDEGSPKFRIVKRLLKVEDGLELISAICFAIAIFRPLSILTLRYFATGAFA